MPLGIRSLPIKVNEDGCPTQRADTFLGRIAGKCSIHLGSLRLNLFSECDPILGKAVYKELPEWAETKIGSTRNIHTSLLPDAAIPLGPTRQRAHAPSQSANR
jgi:hypothetical protein